MFITSITPLLGQINNGVIFFNVNRTIPSNSKFLLLTQ